MAKMDLVGTSEFLSRMLEGPHSQEYAKASEGKSADFLEGAQWGISFGAMYANAKSRHYYLDPDNTPSRQCDDILLYYPCNYCGECPIWLAAYEIPELSTSGEVVEACRKRGCSLVGMPVPREELI